MSIMESLSGVVPLYMMTSSNGSMFRVTGPLCGEFTGHWWIPLTEASDAGLWCFLWSTPNKRLSKQSWGRWFETPSRTLWRHCNDLISYHTLMISWLSPNGAYMLLYSRIQCLFSEKHLSLSQKYFLLCHSQVASCSLKNHGEDKGIYQIKHVPHVLLNNSIMCHRSFH